MKGEKVFCSFACKERHWSIAKPKERKKKKEFPFESTAHLHPVVERRLKKQRKVRKSRAHILELEAEVKELRSKLKAWASAPLASALTSKFVDPFFESREWQTLRYRALKVYGRKCMNCGTVEGVLQVDHIKPRSKYPQLSLEFSNLQVLCKPCNMGKGNTDETDFRPHAGTNIGPQAVSTAKPGVMS